MRDSPAQVIAQYLIDRGAAVSNAPTGTAWGIVSGPIPLSPGVDAGMSYPRFIGVTDTGAYNQGKLHTGERSLLHTVSVMVRAPFDFNEGWDKCQEIEGYADAVGVFGVGGIAYTPTVVVGGHNYVLRTAHVYVTTTHLGVEEQSNHQLFVINLQVIAVEV